MTGMASAGRTFARDGSQRHVNRDVKQRSRDSKNSCFFIQTWQAHGHLRQAAWANCVRTCEEDCQKHTGCSHTPTDHLGGTDIYLLSRTFWQVRWISPWRPDRKNNVATHHLSWCTWVIFMCICDPRVSLPGEEIIWFLQSSSRFSWENRSSISIWLLPIPAFLHFYTCFFQTEIGHCADNCRGQDD